MRRSRDAPPTPRAFRRISTCLATHELEVKQNEGKRKECLGKWMGYESVIIYYGWVRKCVCFWDVLRLRIPV